MTIDSSKLLRDLSVGLLASRRGAEVNGTLASLAQDRRLPAGTDVLVVFTGDAVGRGDVELIDPVTRAEPVAEVDPSEAWSAVRGRLAPGWHLLVSDDVRLTYGCLSALVEAASASGRPVAAAVVRDERALAPSVKSRVVV